MPPSTPLRLTRAFTLIEMLVVMAIVVILIAIAVPSLQGTSRAYQLDATGQMVINQLTLARQSALSNSGLVSGSGLVQVRFYLLPDYNQSASASLSVYRAMQCFSEAPPAANGTLALTPLTKPIFFPAPVIISTTTSPNNVSPLLSTTPTTPTAAPAGTDPSLPVYQMNYQYSNFHFKLDGSTDLTSGQNSITLVLENDKAGTSGLPNNYETIQIDPAIGTARRFLP